MTDMPDQHKKTLVNQSRWRMFGTICIILGAIMSISGIWGLGDWLRAEPMLFLLYWLIVAVLLAIAVFIALLDLRYIRVQYASAKRDLFLETLSAKSLREAAEHASHSEDTTEHKDDDDSSSSDSNK